MVLTIPKYALCSIFVLTVVRSAFGEVSALDSSPDLAPGPTCTPDLGFCEFPLPTLNAYPNRIVAGPDGNLWFTETKSGKVGRISLTGDIMEFQTPSGAGSLTDITVAPDNKLWFTEGGYTGSGPNDLRVFPQKIGTMTLQGAVTEFNPSPGLPELITTGLDGSVWYSTGLYFSALYKINPQGGTSRVLSPSGALGLTRAADGTIWMSQDLFGHDFVSRVDPDGSVTAYPTSLVYPRSITPGTDGALWFVEPVAPGRIGRVTLSGSVTEFALNSGLVPVAITAGPDGNMWFLEIRPEDPVVETRIGRITPSGVVTEFALPGSVSFVGSIVLGQDGNLWFTERSANKIARFVVPLQRERPARQRARPRTVEPRVLGPPV